MPLYEYECGECGERFEAVIGPHMGTAEDDVRCPGCGAARARRLLSAPGRVPRLTMTPRQDREMQDKRRVWREKAKRSFSERRRRGREGRSQTDG